MNRKEIIMEQVTAPQLQPESQWRIFLHYLIRPWFWMRGSFWMKALSPKKQLRRAIKADESDDVIADCARAYMEAQRYEDPMGCALIIHIIILSAILIFGVVDPVLMLLGFTK